MAVGLWAAQSSAGSRGQRGITRAARDHAGSGVSLAHPHPCAVGRRLSCTRQPTSPYAGHSRAQTPRKRRPLTSIAARSGMATAKAPQQTAGAPGRPSLDEVIVCEGASPRPVCGPTLGPVDDTQGEECHLPHTLFHRTMQPRRPAGLLMSGGPGRTRTYEGCASGFTVRPLCRSGHRPMFSKLFAAGNRPGRILHPACCRQSTTPEPTMGIEPIACRLPVGRFAEQD